MNAFPRYYIYKGIKRIMDKHHQTINKAFARFIRGFYTVGDAEELFRFFHTPEGRMQVDETMEEVWHESEQAVPVAASEAYKKEAAALLKRIRRHEQRRYLLRPFLKYAALLILCLLPAYGLYTWLGGGEMHRVLYTEVTAGKGENRSLTLPDGSRATLNAGSVLKYPTEFRGDLRQIEMNGEAFFEVSSDKTKPFLIHTRDADIRVLGTSFNVKAYEADEEVAICVKTGKVEVALAEGTIRLTPDEEIVFDKGSREISKRRISADKVTAWLKGGLYFNRTPVKSVVRQLERIYNCRITFKPGFVYDDYLYGEHDNKSLESVLNSIRHSTGIHYRKEGDTIILYKDK